MSFYLYYHIAEGQSKPHLRGNTNKREHKELENSSDASGYGLKRTERNNNITQENLANKTRQLDIKRETSTDKLLKCCYFILNTSIISFLC